MASDQRICLSLKYSLCAITAIWSIYLTPLQAAEHTVTDNVRDFALARYRDGQRLIEGPREPAPATIPAGLSCIELYERRLELIRQSDDYKPSYWDDPRIQAAAFIGTIWTPAFYFLGYSAITAHLDELHTTDSRPNLNAIRRASATQRCFEK
ncbi:MAG: hypothetical protein O3C28_19265 [Proteobacteria bacterium]|nr:hypothetical protein [Pseudomonadota bacterium]